jgi:undecaprenyl-diphosphatase
MDYKIFEIINALAGHSRFFDALGVFLGVYLIYFVGVFVAVVSFDKKYFRNAVIALVSSIIGRFVIVETIKRIVDRPRPYEVLNVHLLVVDAEKGMSFSSGHTVILFCIAFSFYKTKYFYPLLVFATLGSVARIFIGVHYPTDVLASVVIAWATVWLSVQAFQKRKFGLK